MRLKPMRTISELYNSEIIYRFLIYVYCETRTAWAPSLVVSVSDYGTGALGSIPGCVHKLQCFLSFFFSVFMLKYFILVIWNYKNDKTFHSFTFYIELCKKYVGVWVHLALLEENKFGEPIFLFFLERYYKSL